MFQLQQENVLICPGDVPFIHTETIRDFIRVFKQQKQRLSVLGLSLKNPFGYGRLQLCQDGSSVNAIIEEKDCKSDEERAIQLCNSGILLANADYLGNELLPYLCKENNAQKEYYLTDCVGIARKAI